MQMKIVKKELISIFNKVLLNLSQDRDQQVIIKIKNKQMII
jgi:hypothetical protein